MNNRKKTILGLKKLDMSYNPDYINYTYDKFKDMMLKYASQEKSLMHQ